MIKKTCILLFAAATALAPAMAQGGGGNGASFAPKAGQLQVTAILGNNTMFSQNEGLNYLLPTYYSDAKGFIHDTGLESVAGRSKQSVDPGMYLNIDQIGSNSLINLVGLQAKYFLVDNIDVNLMFSMNIAATPSKSWLRGDTFVPNLPIQASKFIEGRLTNTWMVNAGGNYYFSTSNDRISLYAGARIGWQQARVQASLPYSTGEGVSDENTVHSAGGSLVTASVQMYIPSSRAGQIWGLSAGLVAGVEFGLAPGLVLGFEVEPGMYRYDRISIIPKGQDIFLAGHHRVNIFSQPSLRLGFRF